MKSHQALFSGEFHLSARAPALSWTAPAAAKLSVVRGSAWITRVGGAEDLVLRAGETQRIAAGERLTVGSLLNGVPLDLAWQAQAPVPSALQRLAGVMSQQASRIARRTRAAVRRLSLTEAPTWTV